MTHHPFIFRTEFGFLPNSLGRKGKLLNCYFDLKVIFSVYLSNRETNSHVFFWIKGLEIPIFIIIH